MVSAKGVRRCCRHLFSRWKCGKSGSLTPLTYLVLLLGWRMSSFAIGGVTLFLAVISWSILRDNPEDKGWKQIEEKADLPSSAEDNLPEAVKPRNRFGIVFSKPGFWMITISTFSLEVRTYISRPVGSALPDGYLRLQPTTGRWTAYDAPPRFCHRGAYLRVSIR